MLILYKVHSRSANKQNNVIIIRHILINILITYNIPITYVVLLRFKNCSHISVYKKKLNTVKYDLKTKISSWWISCNNSVWNLNNTRLLENKIKKYQTITLCNGDLQVYFIFLFSETARRMAIVYLGYNA